MEGTLQHTAGAGDWEYSVVLTLRNEKGEEIARQVVGVGALRPTEARTFTLSVDVVGVGSGVYDRLKEQRLPGTLYEVQVLESSGQQVLDQAALRIVRLAAPFAPFTGDLADIDRLEIIRTWRFERGDRLSSN